MTDHLHRLPPLRQWRCGAGHSHSLDARFEQDNHLGTTAGLWLDVQLAEGRGNVRHYRCSLMQYHTQDFDNYRHQAMMGSEAQRFQVMMHRMVNAIMALPELSAEHFPCLYRQDWYHIADALLEGFALTWGRPTSPAPDQLGFVNRVDLFPDQRPLGPTLIPDLSDARNTINAWLDRNVSDNPGEPVRILPAQWNLNGHDLDELTYAPVGDGAWRPSAVESESRKKASERADLLFARMFPNVDRTQGIVVPSKHFKNQGAVYVVASPERVYVWTRARRWLGFMWQETQEFLYAGYLCIIYPGELPEGDKYTACLLRLRDDEVAVWREVVAWGKTEMKAMYDEVYGKDYQSSLMGALQIAKKYDPNCISGESWLY